VSGPTPPVIGVLVGRSPRERYSLHRGYVDAVVAVGGLPVVMPAGPGMDITAVVGWIQSCSAVVATGGGDLDPSLYGRQPSTTLMEVDMERDEVEIAAVRAARVAGLRVLGICRGLQLLAVADGGTLVSDVVSAGYDDHWDETRQYEPVHGIDVKAGSLAELALGTAERVNSIHHQAVAEPGGVLTPTAWAPDGLIEALEGPDVLGIQWHPERLVAEDDRHLAPFRWVVHG
jgi:putative glutamine amidotransferase